LFGGSKGGGFAPLFFAKAELIAEERSGRGVVSGEREEERGGAGERGEKTAASRESGKAEGDEKKKEGGLEGEIAFVDELEPGRKKQERKEGQKQDGSEEETEFGFAGNAASASKEKPEEWSESEKDGEGFFAEKLGEGRGEAEEIGGGDAVAVEIAEECVGDAEPGGTEPLATFEREMVQHPDDPGDKGEHTDEASEEPGAGAEADEAPVEKFLSEEDEEGEVVGKEES